MKNRMPKLYAALLLGISVLAIVVNMGAAADAQVLTLTSDGTTLGFTLSTFATLDPGNSGCCAGPFGVAVAAPDRILVFNNENGTRYVFHDADGQTIGTAITSTTTNPTGTLAYATAGGSAYGGTAQGGQFAQFDSSGNVVKVLTGVPQTTDLGMWGNPNNGHILATTAQGTIIDIDPAGNGGTGSSRTVVNAAGDGVAVSPDGTVVYNEISSHIYGFDIATGTQVFDSGFLDNGPDGAGVITSDNNLNGMILVNFNGNGFNSGSVGLLDPATNQLTIIADGGTRGDYVAADVTNGTLFLDYSDVVYRLSCGQHCSIGQRIGPCALPAPKCQPR